MLTVAMPLEVGTVSTLQVRAFLLKPLVAMPLEVGTVSTARRLGVGSSGRIYSVAMPLEVGTISTKQCVPRWREWLTSRNALRSRDNFNWKYLY